MQIKLIKIFTLLTLFIFFSADSALAVRGVICIKGESLIVRKRKCRAGEARLGSSNYPGEKGDTGATGDTSSFLSAPAGGDLSGSFPDPDFKSGAIDSSELANSPYVRLFGNSLVVNKNFPNNTETLFAYHFEDSDEFNMADLTQSDTQVIIPTNGVYIIDFSANWGNGITGVQDINIYVNDSLVASKTKISSGTGSQISEVVQTLSLSSSDIVTVKGKQTSGGALAVSVTFELYWLAPI